MTQVFDDAGVVTPVTIIQAGPCFVTQVKDVENDGYTAVQLGFGEVSTKRLTKGQQGHLGVLKRTRKVVARTRASGRSPSARVSHEQRRRLSGWTSADGEQFTAGDKVDVIGKTKGRGFAGVVKRHGYAGGVRTTASLTAGAPRFHRLGHRNGSCSEGQVDGRVVWATRASDRPKSGSGPDRC